MKNKQWLISWIGKADHDASELDEASGQGPIATALQAGLQFDRVCLLTNFPHERSAKFCEWLEKKFGFSSNVIDLQEMDLVSPIHYASIYEEVSKHLKVLGLPREDVDLTFHLSPGTPAMAAIWIMLAKTRFPSKLIQTSKENGLDSVDFQFDLASDFLPEYLQRSGQRIERLANGPQEAAPHFGKIIHKSAAVKSQIQLAQRIAAHDVPVLILGETGTGKELFAEAIRAASDRAQKPFITVNCGAIAPELANSELFGHVKGAFTGAAGARKGHFQEADGGTLFLDEVGDLPPDTQVRLLRALQAKEVTPLGDSKAIKVDARIIAATHRDLAADVASGRFREDLFHRLAVGILKLPPLREREGDVDLLIDKGEIANQNALDLDSKWKDEAVFELNPVVNIPGPSAMAIPIGIAPGYLKMMTKAQAPKNRRFQAYCFSSKHVEEVELEFPAEVRITRIPSEVSFDNGLIRYSARYELLNKTLKVQRTYQAKSNSPICGADEDVLWQQFHDVLTRDMRSQVFFD